MTLQHCARQGILASFKKFLQGLRIGSQFAPVLVNSRSILKTNEHAKTAQYAVNTMKNIAVYAGNFYAVPHAQPSTAAVATTNRLNNSIFFSWLTDLENKDEETSYP